MLPVSVFPVSGFTAVVVVHDAPNCVPEVMILPKKTSSTNVIPIISGAARKMSAVVIIGSVNGLADSLKLATFNQ